MTDIRYPISGNIRAWFTPENGFANPAAPTVAELTASVDISDAISWNDKDFGTSASNTVDDPAITAKGKVSDRGAAQYGGGLSFYYPLDRTDTTSIYKRVEDLLGTPGVRGFITVRVDGLELSQTAGTTARPGTLPAAGDFVTVYKVETAGYAQSITGEEAFRYTVSFLPKGFVRTFAIVRASAAAVVPVIVGTGGSGAVGTKGVLTATLLSRRYTRGLQWRSSNPTAVTVTKNGVFIRNAVGTSNITAVDPATNTPSTAVVVTVA